MWRVAVLALALTLVFASPSQAGWRIERATQIAEVGWHEPCAGRVALRWEPLAAAATASDCTVTFSTVRKSWNEFCTALIHEYGHLAGYRDPLNTHDPLHSSNPESVMAIDALVEMGGGGEVESPDRRCRKRGRPYLERHGILTSRRSSRR